MGELVAELLEDAPSLKFVTLGGEKFKYYRKRTYQMINGYGPTENTVSSTEFWVDKQYDEGRITVITDNELVVEITKCCKELGIIL